MSLFSWNTSSDTSSIVIETPEDGFFDDPNIQWDNLIIIDLDPCFDREYQIKEQVSMYSVIYRTEYEIHV